MATGRQPELDATERRWQEALELVMRLRHRSDQEIADALGWARATVGHRRTGSTRIRPGEIDALARALDVPADLFALDVGDILAWFSQHPEMSIRQYGCIHAIPDQTGRATAA